MNFESGFLSENENLASLIDSDGFSGFQTLYSSKTGFFRILVGKHLGRKVVIKTLKEEHAGNLVAVTQLKKEFGIVFPLVTPNVVHAFNLFKLENDLPAFEMEWCEGSDVRQLLNGELLPEDAVRIIEGVLNGLKDIHLAGIVHRDIKPENIIYDPFRKVVKIIDFGCAYVNGGLALQGPNGTPGYTPEEKMNPSTQAEPKDDFYALGVMVAEIAESLSVSSGRGVSVKRKLKAFSDNLKAGEYEKSESPLEAFEKLFHKKKNHSLPVAAGLIAIFIVLLLLLNIYLPKHISDQNAISNQPLPDSLESVATTGTENPEVKSGSEINEASTPAPGIDKSAPDEAANTHEPEEDVTISMPYIPGEWKNPYSGISDEDEAAYELACQAGKLMEVYNSRHASKKVNMDGTVVHFCDSLWLAEKMSSKYPRHIEHDDMRDLAKELAAKYKNEMERVFRNHFGEAGDPHHREVLLEGRFYCCLRAYNNNPWIKESSKKSN